MTYSNIDPNQELEKLTQLAMCNVPLCGRMSQSLLQAI